MRFALRLTPPSFRKVVPAMALVLAHASVNATVYNFDMTSLTPGPVYDSVELNYLSIPLNGLSCSVFGGLDLLGGLIDGCAGQGTFTWVYTHAAMIDGLFSINLISGGSAPFSNLFAVGVRDGVRTAPLVLIPPVTAIPEPGTIALVALAMAGMVISRRRKP